ncbi:MAG TPA: hypothetical protein VL961_10210 [Acidimicrobiales bacterium]|nr:hypothetical protein [Acidimicrobiales bacterium]
MPLSAEHEGLHPAGSDDADWQESVYLAWRDARSGLGGNHRIGNELNRRTANLWCGVYHQDGTRFRCNKEGDALRPLEEPGLCAGPQRLALDGEDLVFTLDGEGCTAVLHIIDDPGSLAEAGATAFGGTTGAAGTIFSNNFHLFCRVHGTVELDGRTWEVDAPAWRDHSWGVRRWDSFVSSRSFGGSAGDLQFRYGSMVGTNGSFFRHGSLEHGGQALEVASADMVVLVDDDSVRCRGADVRYHLADGAVTVVRMRTIGGMVGSTAQRCGWECVGDVEVDGTDSGWAFLEVNLNARNGADAPMFVLDEAMTNGVRRPE